MEDQRTIPHSISIHIFSFHISISLQRHHNDVMWYARRGIYMEKNKQTHIKFYCRVLKFYPYRNPTILTQTTIYVLVWDSIWSKADICYVTKVKFTNLLKVNENRAWENIFFQNSPNLDSNAIYLHYCCHNGLDLRDLTNIQSPMTRSLPLKFNSYL